MLAVNMIIYSGHFTSPSRVIMSAISYKQAINNNKNYTNKNLLDVGYSYFTA